MRTFVAIINNPMPAIAAPVAMVCALEGWTD